MVEEEKEGREGTGGAIGGAEGGGQSNYSDNASKGFFNQGSSSFISAGREEASLERGAMEKGQRGGWR